MSDVSRQPSGKAFNDKVRKGTEASFVMANDLRLMAVFSRPAPNRLA